ncbi:MAG: hypothetical protein Q7T19_05520 [Caulobacter sp.]|nr:hypothetical protein [Caulobacter sp.]
MRATTATAVFAVTALAAAGLGAATSMSAATDGLSSDSLLAGATVGDAFSGASARAPEADLDAPIKTGRWAEDAAPVELAGGPAPAGTAEPAPEPIRLSRATVPAAPVLTVSLGPERRAAAPLSVPLSRMAWAPPASAPRVPRESRIDLTVSDQAIVVPGSGLDIASNAFDEPVMSPRPSRPLPDVKRLTLRIGPSGMSGRKGRWFVFAAGSGQAFGLNLMRDPLHGWKPAGWSVERLAEFGKAQLGIGWRRGSQQIAVSAARREISAYGMSREDTVLGVTFTVSGRPPAKTRYEQRLPKAY